MNAQFIDWLSPRSHLFFNPQTPSVRDGSISLSALPQLLGHIWIASSGSTTTSSLSFYALSKSAFLISAEAVNAHLQANSSDIWLNVLPTFHVGGLGVFARAYLSQSKVIDRSHETWSAPNFISWANDNLVTLTSLVPTQVYDLIQHKVRCPKSLRAIVVGGAKLEADLYILARQLGYPILPSFGMTEVCSQIATAELNSLRNELSPCLKVLPHVEVKIVNEGLLAIRSKSLFTAKGVYKKNHIEILWRANDWHVTQDRAKLSGQYLEPSGRANEQIKILGELIDLTELRTQFADISNSQNFYIFAQPDERRGAEISIILERTDLAHTETWVKKFNLLVVPVAKIKAAYFVDHLPTTDLGKIKSQEVLALVCFQ